MSDFLTPTKRKAIYAAMSALASIVVLLGLAPEVTVNGFVGLVTPILGLAAVIMAAIKAKRVDYSAFYAAAAGTVGALVAAGLLADGQASKVYELLAAGVTAIPLIVAVLRTNTTVPSGQPEVEYQAQHAAP